MAVAIWTGFMPRKRKLDKYVSVFTDRHGTERFRFRRDGSSRYLPPPGSKEYKEAYAEALTGVAKLARAKPGTVNDLVSRFYQSISFRMSGAGWQTTLRQIIEPFREKYGSADVTAFTAPDFDLVIAAKLEQKVVDGRKVGGTHAAHRLRETLIRLFEFAVAQGMVDRNHAKYASKVKHKVKGYHTWSEADIRAYRERWPNGTKARLAMELMLWTGARRGNAHRMKPPVNGRIREIAVKTGKVFDIPVAEPLQQALDAMDEIGQEAIIVTSHGKPYSVAGFGNKMREWCNAAGLPQCTAHGIRSALATRGANAGVAQQGLKALGQWEGDQEVRTYVRKANQIELAESALDAVVEWERRANIG